MLRQINGRLDGLSCVPCCVSNLTAAWRLSVLLRSVGCRDRSGEESWGSSIPLLFSRLFRLDQTLAILFGQDVTWSECLLEMVSPGRCPVLHASLSLPSANCRRVNRDDLEICSRSTLPSELKCYS